MPRLTQDSVQSTGAGQLDMEKRFDSPEMKRARKKLAGQLEHYATNDIGSIDESVMDMFDDMGALYRRNLIDKDLTNGQFGYFVNRWWVACKPYVLDQRRIGDEKDYFSDFEGLANALKQDDPHITEADEKTFLEDEKRLVAY